MRIVRIVPRHGISKAARSVIVQWIDSAETETTVEDVPECVTGGEVQSYLERTRGKRVRGWHPEKTSPGR